MPRILANAIQLYYEENGAGQPLMFIHGLGSSTRDWEFQVPEFSGAHRVVAFDLRGHGRSDKPAGPYSMRMFSADTSSLMKALGLKSASVVGISLGGGIALQLALDAPEMVKTVVVVNSGPAMVGPSADAKKEIETRIGIVRQKGMRAMGEALGRQLFPKAEQESLRRTFIERWAENDPQAYIETLLAMADWNVTNQLGSIRCPALIISADQDYSPVAAKEAYVKLMPDAELVVITDAHHATPLDQPKKFNAALAAFLAKHP
ncbi:MAG: alpha/beta hydrolase [Anaerolineales bacterium]|jgi:pimeloyl-ACP methyl ester carboxylesterase